MPPAPRRARARPLLLAIAGLALLAAGAPAQDVGSLRPGHWVQVKGALEGEHFLGSSVEVLQPDNKETLVGTVTSLDQATGAFLLLGQRVLVTARTELQNVTTAQLPGTRVKVGGHWRGYRRFDARKITPRKGAGRDRLEGRVDAVQRVDGALELTIMRWLVRVPADLPLELEGPLQDFQLAPEKSRRVRPQEGEDDDEIPRALSLTDTISYGLLLELKREREDEFDLDTASAGDRSNRNLSARMELVWEPTDDFYALGRVRYGIRWRRDDGSPSDQLVDPDLSELYGFWRDPFGGGVDLQLGRQDFDDVREWLYDKNLDALRAIWTGPGARLEVSASTVVADGGPRNRDRVNYMAMLSNNDRKKHLAAYVIDRRERRGPEDKPIHFGVRAVGDWLPDHDLWLEAAMVRGWDATGDIRGRALDLGTTWSPDGADPFYFTVGYALGSGDDDPTDDVDESFRQTGLQDNNGKFGGVTSFRYYGELVDPELTNLGILTLGVGAHLSRRSSLDLVWHEYRQLEAAASLGRSNLDATPNGVTRDLGWGLDLILGVRDLDPWDLEVVVSRFEPGDAFGSANDAWLTKIQLRYRF